MRMFKFLVQILCAPSPLVLGVELDLLALCSQFAFLSSASRQTATASAHAGGLQEPLKFVRPVAFLSAASLQLSLSHSLFLSLFPSCNLISVFLSIFQLLSSELF